jgi:hypothetical protein
VQVVGVREVGDLPQLGQRVAGAELRRLGDRDRSRLHEVLVAAPGQPSGDQLGGELSVRGRDGQELGAEDVLGRAALVGVDVRGVRADDALVPAQQQAQAEHVGARAVQHQERAVGAERLAQRGGHPLGPRIGAVGDRVTGVGIHDRTQHRGVRTGVVVAAEALALCHGNEPMGRHHPQMSEAPRRGPLGAVVGRGF